MIDNFGKHLSCARLIVAAALGLLFQQTSFAVPVTSFDADVTEWSSTTVPVPGVILPIGGSGQVNGNFIVVEDDSFPNIQIGLRAVERFSPVPLPNSGSNYVAQAGESGGPGSGLSTWNYETHIDLRGSGLSFDDFTITFTTSILNHSTADFQADLEAFSLVPAGTLDNVELFQASFNPGFFFSGLDPFAPGSYPFEFNLIPKSGVSGPTLSASMVVEVIPEPTSAGLVLLGLGTIIGVVRRRK